MSITRTRFVGALAALALITAACGSDGSVDDAVADEAVAEDEEFADDEFADEEFADEEFADEDMADDGYAEDDGYVDEEYAEDEEFADEESSGDTGVAGGVDLTLVRDDVDCAEDVLGSDDTLEFTAAHYVVDGALGALCFGEEDPRLITAWEALSVITPPLQLTDLGLFGAFVGTEDSDEITLAFVNSLDADGSLFQMSVSTDAYEDDPEVGLLTMAHEFAHVFTSTGLQTDRTDEGIDACTTYFNGESCFLEDSLMYQWIVEFWGDGLIDEIDPTGEASISDGQDRCDVNPGFFGAYAASNPEEDFAEAFSAFVFEVEALSVEQQERLDWFAAQPGLDEFRERAIAAGLGPLPHTFDPCG